MYVCIYTRNIGGEVQYKCLPFTDTKVSVPSWKMQWLATIYSVKSGPLVMALTVFESGS